MKKIFKTMLIDKMGNLAVSSLKLSANSTCAYVTHQAKIPKGIEKFKKKI